MTETNFQALDINELDNEQEMATPQINQAFLESPWYADICFVLLNLQAPPGLSRTKNIFVRPLYYQCHPLLLLVQTTYYIDVPMQCPYCYYCAPQKPTIIIIVPLHYYCYVGSDYVMTPQTPIYRKEVFSFVSSKNFSFM